MNKSINRTNIVCLALIYNFISNGTTSVNIDSFNMFKGWIDYSLYNGPGGQWISDEEEEQDYYHYDRKNGCIVLNDVRDLGSMSFRYVDCLPQDILKLSLDHETLKFLSVDGDAIKTRVRSEHKYDTLGVYSTSAASARESVLRGLQNSSYKNIEVGPAFFTKLDSVYGYNVSVSYDIDSIFLDLDSSCKHLIKNNNSIG